HYHPLALRALGIAHRPRGHAPALRGPGEEGERLEQGHGRTSGFAVRGCIPASRGERRVSRGGGQRPAAWSAPGRLTGTRRNSRVSARSSDRSGDVTPWVVMWNV